MSPDFKTKQNRKREVAALELNKGPGTHWTMPCPKGKNGLLQNTITRQLQDSSDKEMLDQIEGKAVQYQGAAQHASSDSEISVRDIPQDFGKGVVRGQFVASSASIDKDCGMGGHPLLAFTAAVISTKFSAAPTPINSSQKMKRRTTSAAALQSFS
ncbi:hypothetical protein P7K49_024905 [Saguinus oedipus]|uniref:Uncharacterized protein n=1 Tax=Saguinus oedipus TaxID=9490 RepID=A0ABQ9UG53_SAGOE|nr:hypothetical protein P7K49_024905 [Saguinus oedipus]